MTHGRESKCAQPIGSATGGIAEEQARLFVMAGRVGNGYERTEPAGKIDLLDPAVANTPRVARAGRV
jgi:hypothetical protein